MAIRVLLADDHKIILEGLASLLEKESDLVVLGKAEDGPSAIEMAKRLSPDVVVMDVAMPGMTGVEATREIKRATPQASVLALSMHADKRYVTGMLGAGARGYILKDSAFEEVVAAVRAVASGETYVSPSLKDILIEDYARRMAQEANPSADPLTAREKEILAMLADGLTARESAAKLHLSVKTIESHRQHIMEKLDLHSMVELTKYAIREGIASLES